MALVDGSFVVERGDGAGLAALVRGLDLAPPYRAEAVRREGTRWALGARQIDVVELGPHLIGRELVIAWDGSERSVRVDGEPTLASVPELEALGALRGDAWVVRARRLRADVWEVEVELL